MVQIDDLKCRIADRYDVEELCDLLNVSIFDIMEAFEDKVLDRLDSLFEVDGVEVERYDKL